jgi:hypothetical protein
MTRTRTTPVYLVFGLVALLLLALPTAASAVAPAGWTVSRVTSATDFGFIELAVSPDLVAMRTTGYLPQMWAWTPGHSAAAPVPGAINVNSLGVSGNRAVWRQNVGGLRPIMTWSVGAAGATTVTAGTRDNAYPTISDGRLAWLSATFGEQTIVTRTFGQTVPSTVSAVDNGPKIDPQVSSDRVVWLGSDGVVFQVFTWAAHDPVARQITTDVSPHAGLRVSGNRVIWMAQDELGEGLLCTWKEGAGVTTIGAAPYEGSPQVSGDRIAWTSGGSGDSQVHLWQAGQTLQVTSGPHWISAVGISGDRLVWRDEVEGQFQIVTKRVGESALTTVAAGTDPLDEPVIGGVRLAWRAFDGSNYQVFTALPPLVATSLTKPTVSPLSPAHGHTATFRSYLAPGDAAFASGGKGTLSLYRVEYKWVTKRVHGVNRRVKVAYWHLRSTATMKRTAGGGERTLLSAGVKPAYSGKWKAIVRFAGSSGYAARTSATAYFTVR